MIDFSTVTAPVSISKTAATSRGKRIKPTANGVTVDDRTKKMALSAQNIRKNAAFKAKNASDIMQVATDYYDPDLEPDSLLMPRMEVSPGLFKRWSDHFYREDPIVGQIIDMHSQLPLSKFELKMPELPPDATDEQQEFVSQVSESYSEMLDKLDFFKQLTNINHQLWLYNNVFPFVSWDDEKRRWCEVSCLSIDNIRVTHVPFVDEFIVQWIIPDELLKLKENADNPSSSGRTDLQDAFSDLVKRLPDGVREILESKTTVDRDEGVVLNTDPYAQEDCVFHLSMNKKNYDSFGVPIISRVMKLLFLKDKLIKAAGAVAERNMAPIHLVYGDDLGEEDILDLRIQVENALSSPDFAVVTNYQVNWDLITGNDRDVDFSRHFDWIDETMMTGLGINKAVLAGEGTYNNAYISQAIVNERYSFNRDVITDFVKDLLKPVAVANDYYLETEKAQEGDANKVEEGEDPEGKVKLLWLVPEIRWTRTNIVGDRDNKQFMQQAFQNGKLSYSTYMGFFDIDGRKEQEKIKADFESGFALMGELTRNLASELSRQLAPYYKELMIEKYEIPKEVVKKVDKAEEDGGRSRY